MREGTFCRKDEKKTLKAYGIRVCVCVCVCMCECVSQETCQKRQSKNSVLQVKSPCVLVLAQVRAVGGQERRRAQDIAWQAEIGILRCSCVAADIAWRAAKRASVAAVAEALEDPRL